MDTLISSGIGIAWHSIRRTISVLCVIAVLGGIAWLIYVGMIRPHTKPNANVKNTADQMIQYTIEPRPTFFGCANFRIEQAKEKEKDADIEDTGS